MPTAWRILKKHYLATAFDGEGARLYGGRWNSPGTAVVYASESRALAILEVLAGIRSTKPMPAYVLIPVDFDDALVTDLDSGKLPTDWRRSPPPPATQLLGDTWVDQRKSAILRVPSVVVPEEYNYVLNPAHPDFGRVRIGTPQGFSFDARLAACPRNAVHGFSRVAPV